MTKLPIYLFREDKDKGFCYATKLHSCLFCVVLQWAILKHGILKPESANRNPKSALSGIENDDRNNSFQRCPIKKYRENKSNTNCNLSASTASGQEITLSTE